MSNRKFTESLGGRHFCGFFSLSGLFVFFFAVATELWCSCVSNWFLREFVEIEAAWKVFDVGA